MSNAAATEPPEALRAAVLARLGADAGALASLGEGDFCTAWLLAGRRVVRAARHATAEGALAREARLLAALADHLPVTVPHPEWYPAEKAAWPAFAVHDFVPGVPLTRTRWRGLREPVRSDLPRRLGAFLRVLHDLDVGVGKAAGLEVVDHAARMRERAEDRRNSLLPGHLREGLRAALQAWVEENAARPYRPAVLHADLSPGHVLVDPQTSVLTGIIDWGDAVVGDPARDLIFLYEDWGPDFLGLALDGYVEDRGAAARMRVRALRHYLADQLDWTLAAAARGRDTDVREGVAALEQALRALRTAAARSERST